MTHQAGTVSFRPDTWRVSKSKKYAQKQGGEPYNMNKREFTLHKVIDSIQVGPSTSSSPSQLEKLEALQMSISFRGISKPRTSLLSLGV